MTTVIASFIIICLIMAAMAVGVIFGRKPIRGTCGGLNNMEGQKSCELCGGSPAKCDELASQKN